VYRKTTPTGDGAVVEFDFPATLAPYLVDKGSVTIDGVSLTVNTVTDGPAGEAGGVFTAFLIPHTLQMTTLGDRKAGDRVNLESDLLGKYVVRALALGIPAAPKTSGGVSQEFLRAHGWV
jgi:riboflavin synthase